MPTTRTRSRVPAEERVFSLVLALIASPQGLTKTDILSSVYGYADRFSQGSNTTAIDRQFERDKDEVRKLGIHIETLSSAEAPGDNRFTRYRISKQRLTLPDTVVFTAEELNLLRLAALAWREGSLGSQSRWASMKIGSLGNSADMRKLGIAPRIGMLEPAAAPLQRAIDERKVVEFDYHLPNRETPLRRTVAPLRLHRADGRWHLIAWDNERSATRVFLLTRITSSVSIQPDHYDETLMGHIESAVHLLLQRSESQTVKVSVLPGSTAEARLQARAREQMPTDEHTVFEIGTLDLDELATELAAFGAEATVLEPEQLRTKLIDKLTTVRSQHEDIGS